MPQMPLTIREEEITWSQTPDYILIKVPVKGVKSIKTNIVTSNDYIRVHYHPFIYETFLWAEVDDLNGKCTIVETENQVIFELPKVTRGTEWESLSKKNLERTEKRVIRDRAVEVTQKRHAERRKALQERRFEENQKTVRDQIRLDGEERERIASVKQCESEKALKELDQWCDGGQGKVKKDSGDGGNVAEASSDAKVKVNAPQIDAPTKVDADVPDLIEAQPFAPQNTQIWTASDLRAKRTPLQPSQPIREPGKITISFTPREFPTPSRESTAAEEQEWLKKQAEARRKCGFNDADLRPEERDPVWLLEKGQSLMQAGSFLGAISAYSHGLKLAPKMPELYMERAAAHLALKNLVKTVEDASQALELYTPKVAANAKERARCHRIRASGFKGLKCYREALLDYKEAYILTPNDIGLKPELEDCEAFIYEMEQRGQDDSDID